MKFSQLFLSQLIEQIDMPSLVSEYVTLKRSGKDWTGCCPFHKEKTPSFSVSAQKGFFYCFGCQAHGNGIDFLMRIASLGFVDAVQQLAQRVGLSCTQEVPAKASKGASGSQPMASKNSRSVSLTQLFEKIISIGQENLYAPEGKKALQYLKNTRQLSDEMLHRAKIGFFPRRAVFQALPKLSVSMLREIGWIQSKYSNQECFYEIFADRIVFPIANLKKEWCGFGGRLFGSSSKAPKYINSPETPFFKKKEIFYGTHLIPFSPQRDFVILTEGYFDVLRWQSLNYPAWGTLGTALSPFQIRALLRRFSRIYVCYDSDSAGTKATWRFIEKVLPELDTTCAIFFIQLPVGEDPDSFLQNQHHSEQAAKTLLDNAMVFSQVFFHLLSQHHSLDYAESRAMFLEKAVQALSSVKHTVLRDQMLVDLARRLGMNSEWFVQALKAQRFHPRKQLAASLNVHAPLQHDCPIFIKRIFAILLQYPQVALDISVDITPLKKIQEEKTQLCLALLRQAQKQYKLNLGQRLELWRSTPYFHLLGECAGFAHLIDQPLLKTVLEDDFMRLAKENIALEAEKLIKNLPDHPFPEQAGGLYLKLIKCLKKDKR